MLRALTGRLRLAEDLPLGGRSQSGQGIAGSGCGFSDSGDSGGGGAASRGGAVVGGEVGVGGHDADFADGDTEFFGGHHGEFCACALAFFDLAREDRVNTVVADVDAGLARGGVLGVGWQGEDEQEAGAGDAEHLAAGDCEAIGRRFGEFVAFVAQSLRRPPLALSLEASWTAATMRG